MTDSMQLMQITLTRWILKVFIVLCNDNVPCLEMVLIYVCIAYKSNAYFILCLIFRWIILLVFLLMLSVWPTLPSTFLGHESGVQEEVNEAVWFST